MRLTCNEVASMLAAIWIGLILGVCFYAAPIKFTAEGIGREQLLLVGQVTFQGFTWVEFAAFVLLVGASLGKPDRTVVIGLAVLGLFLLVQKFGVLPALDTRLSRTVTGESTGESHLHFIYIAIDCLKLVVLFILSLRLRSTPSARGPVKE